MSRAARAHADVRRLENGAARGREDGYAHRVYEHVGVRSVDGTVEKGQYVKAKFGWSAALALVVVAAACGGDEDGGKGSAKDKCRTFARRACEFLVTCDLADKSDLDECRKDVEDEASCDDAVRVSKSYDECLGDLKDEDECTDDADIPSSCRGVILVDEGKRGD